MTDRWSPAELSRQRLVVRSMALKAEEQRVHLLLARRALAARVRNVARSPWLVGGVLVLGWLLVRGTPLRRGKVKRSRSSVAPKFQRAAATAVALMHWYRRFQAGMAAGAALAAARRQAQAPPSPQPPPAAEMSSNYAYQEVR